MRPVLLGFPWLALLAAGSAWADAAAFQLARGGQGLAPIVVAPGSPQRVRAAAEDLAAMLGRITGAPFTVRTGDGSRGIVVGAVGDFPALAAPAGGGGKAGETPDDYRILTESNRVVLLGRTELGVEHAVWDFLYRLGYRQFFPGERWEHVPRRPDLAARMEVDASPSYLARRIWYGWGPWDHALEPYRRWTVRNRTDAGMRLHTSHAYGGIIRDLKAEFDRHPEYYALVDGERRPGRHAKLCISNADLRRLVVGLQVERVRKNPALHSISMDPSDGGGWCECDACRALGTPSTRVVLLANEVAEAVTQVRPDLRVGIYAYNEHSPPPAIRVHPAVVVSVATAFLQDKRTVDEIMDGWERQGATLGVREYYAVNTWDRDLPGQARGGNLAYLARTIPAFAARGARYMSAESSDNWGANGLGYYVAARMLWDVREAQRVDALVDDFLQRAFGPAREPMRAFYREVDGSTAHLLPGERLARMFQALDQARTLAKGEPEVMARLDELVLYAHYCALFRRYSLAAGAERQAAFEALVRHAYRMRGTMLVHAKALYRDLVRRDRGVKVPAGAEWNVPEERNPWKSSKPFAAAEIAEMLAQGVRAHPPGAEPPRPRAFGAPVVAAAWSKEAAEDAGAFGPAEGRQEFLLQPRQGQREVVAGITARPGKVEASFFKNGPGQDEVLVARHTFDAEPRSERELAFPVSGPGPHRLVVESASGAAVRLPPEVPAVVVSSREAPMRARYPDWTAYFHLPKGTRTLLLFGGEHGEVVDSQGRPAYWLNGRERMLHAVEVPAGEDGKAWRIRNGRFDVQLLNAPPYFAPTPAQLLLPEGLASATCAAPGGAGCASR